jgi:hypothetical protein
MTSRWTDREKVLLFLALLSLASPLALAAALGRATVRTLASWAVALDVYLLLLLLFLVMVLQLSRDERG